MRFYEFCADDPNNRKPLISLKHINRLKKMKQARRDEFAQRKILMGLMYGDPDDKQADRERELDMREREVTLLKSEIQALIDRAEIDQESRQHIQKMARREVGRRIKD